jgi:hypothetical protein
LAAARARGIVTLLVTGRLLEDVQRACDELSRFDGGGRRERRKIERAILSGATPAPEIIAHIENHYLIEA